MAQLLQAGSVKHGEGEHRDMQPLVISNYGMMAGQAATWKLLSCFAKICHRIEEGTGRIKAPKTTFDFQSIKRYWGLALEAHQLSPANTEQLGRVAQDQNRTRSVHAVHGTPVRGVGAAGDSQGLVCGCKVKRCSRN